MDRTLRPRDRAAVTLAVALREMATYARDMVGDLGVPLPGASRSYASRRLRLLALHAHELAVLLDLLNGATVDEVAAANAMTPVEVARHALCAAGAVRGLSPQEVQRRYGPVVVEWTHGTPSNELDAVIYGSLTTHPPPERDPDPQGTALTIDAWYARTRDPWDPEQGSQQGPLTRALLRSAGE